MGKDSVFPNRKGIARKPFSDNASYSLDLVLRGFYPIGIGLEANAAILPTPGYVGNCSLNVSVVDGYATILPELVLNGGVELDVGFVVFLSAIFHDVRLTGYGIGCIERGAFLQSLDSYFRPSRL